MEVALLELPSGLIVNLNAIRTLDTARSNRVDWTGGGHLLLSEADTEALRSFIQPPGVATYPPNGPAAVPTTQENGGETKKTPPSPKRNARTSKTKT